MAELNENIESAGNVSYPSETIKTCFDLTDEIVKHKGTATPLNRQEISVITGKAVQTLIMKLSTCVQYGILNNVYGRGYQPSQLYEQHLTPTYEEDKKKVLLKILINPTLYSRLIDEFNGKILPPEHGIANHLKNVYKLNPNSAVKAAKVFLENLRYVGIIDMNNRLKYIVPSDNFRDEIKELENKESAPIISTAKSEEKIKIEVQRDSLFELPIPLPNKRKAYLKYPIDDLTAKDIIVIRKALDFIASSIMDVEDLL